ncbi:HtrA protease/chaperone protein [Labilithrix luteola]|uniref:HtrA protease/chaperone protein n=1 Tax=Labilithrix luteola TaxID=1391654 RepID=A0A0K1PY47_9BACT|nr:trypsin-like peptidase domain-containing protein [Labilithrix luteola]AKU98069.1 HtrA protease/chaperone protein [Labilithrix luteola]
MKPAGRIARSFLAPTLVAVAALASGCKPKEQARSDGLPPGAIPVPSASAVAEPTRPPTSTLPQKAPAAEDIKMAPLSFAPIAKRADGSVVTIYTVGEEEGRGLFARKGRSSRAQKGLGTGFVVDNTGVIITNNHVIDGADEIVVQLSDERRFPGKIVGRDARTDIAVVKIEGVKDLSSIPLGDSDNLEVGDWVVAIGNPFGLSHTVSAGIVSAKGRGREDVPLDPSGYYNFLQTDASINPGNSGGPLLNLKGEVVGMNTAIRGGGAQGIGFAIPINMVKQLMPTLLKEGHVTRSALGVRIRDVRDLSPEDKQQLKVTDEKGAVIEYVDTGGPADKAKLEVGDVIVAFDGQAVERGTLLQWLASTAGVGKLVTVRVIRAGKPFELKVTLGELKEPKNRGPSFRPRVPQPSPDDEDEPFPH